MLLPQRYSIALTLCSLALCIHVSVALPPEHADQIIVVKSQHTMTLLAHGKPIKVYRVALGTGDAGPKEHQGDHKTPEGKYIIDSRNSNSRFHLALHVSYPNAADKAHAKAQGLPPGGDIMIHGVEKKYEYLGAIQHNYDWTDGCIAVTNSEIEEIWALVPIGTPVEIRH
jgi:murein L,D-transpeptidase YafK